MSNILDSFQCLDYAIPEELWNSTEKILKYANISKERAQIFQINLDYFRNLKDKTEFDSNSIRIIEMINSDFFEIYYSVLRRVMAENNRSPLYQMFLSYAYMDEKLLEPEQCRALYYMVDEPVIQGQCSYYYLKDWMKKIYKKDAEPSVNEFGQDYYDIFRDKVKRGLLNVKDKTQYDNNADARFDHEFTNLFKIGHKLCSGHVNAYFPILHSGMIKSDISNLLISPERLESSLNRVLEVDFSAFHREIVYNQPEKGISKELIMKLVLPDLILMPVAGPRAIMWQELGAKVKNSPGRFVFPIFPEGDLDNLMVDLVAKFRWDLSKNMFSYARNDTYQSSLTGDYSQYIQFYKKNNDLSSDAKEKIKTQIARHRNNIREIFAADYYTWINYEAKGLTRLNKVAREIFFKHCPFAKPIRQNMANHPLYSQYITRFESTQLKNSKVIQARYSKLLKNFTLVDEDLTDNLSYYEM